MSTQQTEITIPATNLALSATATASTETISTGQTASKAIDGVIGGYPVQPYSVEWATAGGHAGSWLKLTWAAAQTFNTIVLYDRPNSADQITGGHIQFSDGSTVNVGTLPNDGSAYTLTFAAKTATWLQLNITSVSASTLNVGLAEIQIYKALVPPNVTTGAPTGISRYGATFQGTVNAEGWPTSYHFDIGPTTSYGEAQPLTDASAGSGSTPQPVSYTMIEGLTPGTTYHCRIAATNSGGTAYGGDVTFTTQPPIPR